jgi:hypothetical protein
VWYLKGLHAAAEFRSRLFKEKSYEAVIGMLRAFFDNLDPSSVPGFR